MHHHHFPQQQQLAAQAIPVDAQGRVSIAHLGQLYPHPHVHQSYAGLIYDAAFHLANDLYTHRLSNAARGALFQRQAENSFANTRFLENAADIQLLVFYQAVLNGIHPTDTARLTSLVNAAVEEKTLIGCSVLVGADRNLQSIMTSTVGPAMVGQLHARAEEFQRTHMHWARAFTDPNTPPPRLAPAVPNSPGVGAGMFAATSVPVSAAHVQPAAAFTQQRPADLSNPFTAISASPPPAPSSFGAALPLPAAQPAIQKKIKLPSAAPVSQSTALLGQPKFKLKTPVAAAPTTPAPLSTPVPTPAPVEEEPAVVLVPIAEVAHQEPEQSGLEYADALPPLTDEPWDDSLEHEEEDVGQSSGEVEAATSEPMQATPSIYSAPAAAAAVPRLLEVPEELVEEQLAQEVTREEALVDDWQPSEGQQYMTAYSRNTEASVFVTTYDGGALTGTTEQIVKEIPVDRESHLQRTRAAPRIRPRLTVASLEEVRARPARRDIYNSEELFETEAAARQEAQARFEKVRKLEGSHETRLCSVTSTVISETIFSSYEEESARKVIDDVNDLVNTASDKDEPLTLDTLQSAPAHKVTNFCQRFAYAIQQRFSQLEPGAHLVALNKMICREFTNVWQVRMGNPPTGLLDPLLGYDALFDQQSQATSPLRFAVGQRELAAVILRYTELNFLTPEDLGGDRYTVSALRRNLFLFTNLSSLHLDAEMPGAPVGYLLSEGLKKSLDGLVDYELIEDPTINSVHMFTTDGVVYQFAPAAFVKGSVLISLSGRY